MEVIESFQADSQNVPDVSESCEINKKPKNKYELITKEDMEYIKTHSAVEIAKHFNRSTTWAYSRMNGTKTTY